MKDIRVPIPIGENEKISGILSIPEGKRNGKKTGIILAHGAGNDMENPLLAFLSAGLAERGYLALRFNFPYKEKGKRAPDGRKKLFHTWKCVYHFLKEDSGYGVSKIIASGKSMGGRVASQMASEGILPAGGLIFFGYPLHPPGKKDRLRDAHLYNIKAPMLFFAGTRDPLCDLSLLKGVLGRFADAPALEVIEGGDHSFKMLKSAALTQGEVYGRILERTVGWMENIMQ
jgi:predicted alpha/beta-hydrolase family hydrolase